MYSRGKYINTTSTTLAPLFEDFYNNAKRYQICQKFMVHII